MKTFYLIVFILSAVISSNGQADTSSNKVFTFVEHVPEFPGGDKELMRFLQKNLQYPAMERDNDIQGKVVVRFVVNEDGTVSDVKVVKAVSPGLDKEAVRVVKLLPNFSPGTQQGKAVKVYFNLPFNFKLEEDQTLTEKLKKDAFYKNAVSLGQQGKYKEGAAQLKKSIAKFPKDYLSYELLGSFEISLGKEKEGCANYYKAKELGSPNAAVLLSKNCK